MFVLLVRTWSHCLQAFYRSRTLMRSIRTTRRLGYKVSSSAYRTVLDPCLGVLSLISLGHPPYLHCHEGLTLPDDPIPMTEWTSTCWSLIRQCRRSVVVPISILTLSLLFIRLGYGGLTHWWTHSSTFVSYNRLGYTRHLWTWCPPWSRGLSYQGWGYAALWPMVVPSHFRCGSRDSC